MNDDKKIARPAEHAGQNGNNLVKEKKEEQPPVTRPDADSISNSGNETGLNQASINNDNIEPADFSDQ